MTINEVNTQTLDSVERIATTAQRLAEKLQLLMLCDTDQLDTVGSMVARKLDALNAALYDLNLNASPIHFNIWGCVKQRKREISE
jgi:hypothetical protein